jgi:hypothetical protein
MNVTQNFSSKTKLRVFGITIAGKFIGFASGVIAKPLVAVVIMTTLGVIATSIYVIVTKVPYIVGPDRHHNQLYCGKKVTNIGNTVSPDGKFMTKNDLKTYDLEPDTIVFEYATVVVRVTDDVEILRFGWDNAYEVRSGFMPDGTLFIASNDPDRNYTAVRIFDVPTGRLLEECQISRQSLAR